MVCAVVLERCSLCWALEATNFCFCCYNHKCPACPASSEMSKQERQNTAHQSPQDMDAIPVTLRNTGQTMGASSPKLSALTGSGSVGSQAEFLPDPFKVEMLGIMCEMLGILCASV